MDRQLAERMVGAACLLAVLVLVVPAILDGNPDSGATITHPAVEEELDLRTHTIRLDGAEREPPVPTPLQAQAARELPADPEPQPAAPADTAPVPEPAPEPAETGAARESPAAPPVVTPPATARPEPAPAGASALSPAGGTGDWIVQLGSFSSRANADRLASEVRGKGFSVSVQGGGGTSGNLFRVRAGPEPDKSAAEALAARLAAAGFKGGRVGRK